MSDASLLNIYPASSGSSGLATAGVNPMPTVNQAKADNVANREVLQKQMLQLVQQLVEQTLENTSTPNQSDNWRALQLYLSGRFPIFPVERDLESLKTLGAILSVKCDETTRLRIEGIIRNSYLVPPPICAMLNYFLTETTLFPNPHVLDKDNSAAGSAFAASWPFDYPSTIQSLPTTIWNVEDVQNTLLADYVRLERCVTDLRLTLFEQLASQSRNQNVATSLYVRGMIGVDDLPEGVGDSDKLKEILDNTDNAFVGQNALLKTFVDVFGNKDPTYKEFADNENDFIAAETQLRDEWDAFDTTTMDSDLKSLVDSYIGKSNNGAFLFANLYTVRIALMKLEYTKIISYIINLEQVVIGMNNNTITSTHLYERFVRILLDLRAVRDLHMSKNIDLFKDDLVNRCAPTTATTAASPAIAATTAASPATISISRNSSSSSILSST